MPVADRVAGYPAPCTISGTTVTLAPLGLDSVFQALLATDGSHYLYNITKNETKAITGKGGTKTGGFTFTVAAIGTWVSGDEIVPIRQSTGYTYATNTAAFAACASLDTIISYGANPTGYHVSPSPLGAVSTAGTATVVHFWGGFADRRTILATPTATLSYNCTGNLSGVTAQVTWQNFTYYGGTNSSGGIYYNDTSGSGGGLLLTRCRAIGCYYVFINGASVAANCCQVDTSEFWYCYNPIYVSVAMLFYHNSFFFGTHSQVVNNNKASTFTNCLELGGAPNTGVRLLSGPTNAVITYCCVSDQSIPVGTGNLRHYTEAQVIPWYYADGGKGGLAPGITTGSACHDAGNFIASITADIFGNAISAGHAPIGCAVGTVNAYGVTWPAANQVITGNNFTNFAGAQTASATGEAHTANQVLKSAGGNYNDDNLSVGNVRPVAFGLSQTGTLANLAPTDTAYTTLEATRNITAGAGNIVSTAHEHIAGAQVDGTYHEATTAEVKDGVMFGPASAYEGTYAGSGTPAAAPDVTAVRVNDTTIRLTVTNAAGTTVRSYYATTANGGDTWTAGGTRSGNGTIDITVTGATDYYLWVLADNGVYSLPSNVIKFNTSIGSGSTLGRWLGFPKAAEQYEVLSDTRDETVISQKYYIGVGATLAAMDLEPGDLLPGDLSAYRIVSSKLTKEKGSNAEQAICVARKYRARIARS